ncbi:hypothetical protein F4604DRAFT_1599742, partial [Suillus subluteus]
LKKNNVNEDFIKNLDPKAIFKDRAYPVVIQFIPLTFNPNSNNQIHAFKQENDWEEGSISLAQWIKPPNKQMDQQQVAHLLVTFKNPNNMNKGIHNGITLNKNCLQPKKNKGEPIQCTKCQHYGHIAHECTSH